MRAFRVGYTKEGAEFLIRQAMLPEERIHGVETGNHGDHAHGDHHH